MSASNTDIALNESDDPVETPIKSFNPFTPEFRANPYPYYHRQRAADPVHWRGREASGVYSWDLTRYVDAMVVLKDRRFGRDVSSILSPEQLAPIPEAFQPLFRMLSYWLPMYDPPKHTRLQKVFQGKFTRKYLETLHPHIEGIVNDLLDTVQPAGKMDFMADFAKPVPMAVMARILGVPLDMCPQLCEWSASILRAVDLAPTGADFVQGTQTVLELYEYFRKLVDERRRQPNEDLISTLVEAEKQGDILNEEEILANCAIMVMAGGETTATLIGTGMLTLLRHPDQLEKLRADSTLYRSAVEELLRYESPVQMTHRVAFEDVDLADKTIRRGERVNVWVGAVNRDPEQFPDPDRLDLARHPNAHLAFGHGIHTCLGYALAHVELQIAFKTLLRRLSHIELQTEHLEWQETVVIRELKSLPLSFSP
ncbi:MAG: cytochrome P450 [bacterium]|nr:cytochrome P450 [bacterium]